MEDSVEPAPISGFGPARRCRYGRLQLSKESEMRRFLSRNCSSGQASTPHRLVSPRLGQRPSGLIACQRIHELYVKRPCHRSDRGKRVRSHSSSLCVSVSPAPTTTASALISICQHFSAVSDSAFAIGSSSSSPPPTPPMRGRTSRSRTVRAMRRSGGSWTSMSSTAMQARRSSWRAGIYDAPRTPGHAYMASWTNT